MLASPIPQEYDAFTVEQATLLAEIGNLAARHNLVEIVEACRREAKLLNWPAGIQAHSNLWKRQLLGCWLVRSRRSTTLSTGDELGVNPANQLGILTDSGFGNMQAALPCGNRRSVSEGIGRWHNGVDASCYDESLRHQATASPLRRSTPSLRASARWLRYLYSLFPSASGYLTDGLRATRKPRLLVRADGLRPGRLADRQPPASKFQLPPRDTRDEPVASCKSSHHS